MSRFSSSSSESDCSCSSEYSSTSEQEKDQTSKEESGAPIYEDFMSDNAVSSSPTVPEPKQQQDTELLRALLQALQQDKTGSSEKIGEREESPERGRKSTAGTSVKPASKSLLKEGASSSSSTSFSTIKKGKKSVGNRPSQALKKLGSLVKQHQAFGNHLQELLKSLEEN